MARGRGGNPRGGRGAGQAPAAAPAAESSEDDDSPDVEFKNPPAGIILLSHAPPKSIRFSVKRELFSNFPNFTNLPERMIGVIDKWCPGGKNDGRIVCEWEADDSSTIQSLCVMLQPRFDFKFERYIDGRAPPRAKGLDAKRKFAHAVRDGPYASWADEAAPTQTNTEKIEVEYEEGPQRLKQIWQPVAPQSITEDWRPGPRFKTKITPDLHPSRYNSLIKMLFNVGTEEDPPARECGRLYL